MEVVSRKEYGCEGNGIDNCVKGLTVRKMK